MMSPSAIIVRADVQYELDRGPGSGPHRTRSVRAPQPSGRREPRHQHAQDEPIHAASVGSEENIAQHITKPAGDPTLRQVIAAVLDHVAALAKAPQIAEPVVRRVIVEMGGGEDHARRAYLDGLHERRLKGRPTTAVPPCPTQWVKPSSVREAANRAAVWPLAALAFALGAIEADAPADFRPMRRVKAAQLGSDWHRPGF
jgi:hypothetical protein